MDFEPRCNSTIGVIMATLQKVFQTLLPQAITGANNCYQEHLRGTSNQELYAPVAARIVAFVPNAFAPYVTGKSVNHPVTKITKIVFAILLQQCLSYYGSSRGYNVDFMKEILVLNLSPQLYHVVENLTTPKKEATDQLGQKQQILDYPSRTDDQRRVARLLHILVGIGTSCILFKFQADRNPLLSLRPYLYFVAGVTILENLERHNRVDQMLDKATSKGLSSNIPCFYLVYGVASKVLIGFGVAQAVKLATGQSIQMAWHWEIASYAASAAARTYL